jgi:hypothetical protein
MMMRRARAGQVIGRDHVLGGVNCQDAYALIEREAYTIGIVCDGCGGGKRSEVGATLAANFLASRATHLLEAGHIFADAPLLLYPQMIDFLRSMVSLCQPADAAAFIHDQLLFTVLGVIVSDEGGVMFAAGDGLIARDAVINERDEGNRPAYIAYHLFDDAALNGYIMPDGFDVYPLHPGWQRLALASDGFETELLPDVWGMQHPRGLQRKLNVWSNRERRFRDDTTIITVEKIMEMTHAGLDRRENR